MGNKTYANLIEGHIYQFDDLLLEAACCDVWTLNLLTITGEYVPAAHGALIAYELRTDGLWERVHCSFFPRLPGGELLTFFQGASVEIDLARLIVVAARRSDVQDSLHELEQDQQFRELMAVMDW